MHLVSCTSKLLIFEVVRKMRGFIQRWYLREVGAHDASTREYGWVIH